MVKTADDQLYWEYDHFDSSETRETAEFGVKLKLIYTIFTDKIIILCVCILILRF